MPPWAALWERAGRGGHQVHDGEGGRGVSPAAGVILRRYGYSAVEFEVPDDVFGRRNAL